MIQYIDGMPLFVLKIQVAFSVLSSLARTYQSSEILVHISNLSPKSFKNNTLSLALVDKEKADTRLHVNGLDGCCPSCHVESFSPRLESFQALSEPSW